MRLSHRTSGWLHERCQPLKQGLLEFRAATAGGTWRLPIQARQSRGPATLIDLFKDRAGRLSIAADIDWLATRNGFSTAWRRVGVFVDLLAASLVTSERRVVLQAVAAAVLVDGESAHVRGRVAGGSSSFRPLSLPDELTAYVPSLSIRC